jgi:uncharacterized membrane protein
MPGATTTPGSALAAGLVVTAFLLAGCAQENPYGLPAYDAAAGPSPGPTGSAPGALSARRAADVFPVPMPSEQVTYRPADALGEGAWVEQGKIVARSPTQRAVVRAMTQYLATRVQSSNTWQVDEQALAATASGQAVASARERAEQQRARGQRSIGRLTINVSAVRVDGDRASVTGCHFDATSEVDRDGNVLIAPPGGVLVTMQLRRTGSAWRVLDWPRGPVPSCNGRA